MSPADAGDPTAIVVGRVVRAHGVRGEAVVEPRTDFVDERFAAGVALTARKRDCGERRLVVSAARSHGGRLLVCFDGVASRDDVEQLRGVLLTVDADNLELPEDPDEFHDRQLEGLSVVSVDGTELGTVRHVVHVPASELLAVYTPDHREVLVPFASAIVPEVDLNAGRVVVDPPDGLFE